VKKQSERSKTSSLERVGRTGGGYLRNVKMVERMGKRRRRGREPMQETSEGTALAASVRAGDAAQGHAISQSPAADVGVGASAYRPRPGHPTALELALAVALRRPDCRTARAFPTIHGALHLDLFYSCAHHSLFGFTTWWCCVRTTSLIMVNRNIRKLTCFMRPCWAMWRRFCSKSNKSGLIDVWIFRYGSA
jgi:hypothetical protein